LKGRRMKAEGRRKVRRQKDEGRRKGDVFLSAFCLLPSAF